MMKYEGFVKSILKYTDTNELVAVHMCGFDGIRRGNYSGGESIGRAQVEVRIGELMNGKDAYYDEITGEMIKGGADKVVNWIEVV